MIARRVESEVASLLEHFPAVALVGPRQSGKTALALAIAESRLSVYLDLEAESDRARLAEPALYFADHVDELVILDEIHRAPGLLEALRGTIDQGRREGRAAGRFLLLVLDWHSGRRWVVEIKRSLSPTVERGLRASLADLRPERAYVIYPGEERYRLGESIDAIGLPELCEWARAGGP